MRERTRMKCPSPSWMYFFLLMNKARLIQGDHLFVIEKVWGEDDDRCFGKRKKERVTMRETKWKRNRKKVRKRGERECKRKSERVRVRMRMRMRVRERKRKREIERKRMRDTIKIKKKTSCCLSVVRFTTKIQLLQF